LISVAPSAFGEDHNNLPPLQEGDGTLHGLQVSATAANWKNLILPEQPAKRAKTEQLLLGHEVNGTPNRDRYDDGIKEARVVGRYNRGSRSRNMFCPIDTEAKDNLGDDETEEATSPMDSHLHRLFDGETQ
jgi:hypothetical protein